MVSAEIANEILLFFREYLPKDSAFILKSKIMNSSAENVSNLFNLELHNPYLMILASLFLGFLGVDRFIRGDVWLGVVKLLFGWVFLGIWEFVDVFLCYKKAKEKNLIMFCEVLENK